MTGGKCSRCRRWRPLSELLVFWLRSDPSRRPYVCRPALPELGAWRCFRGVVGGTTAFGIAQASPFEQARHADPGRSDGPLTLTDGLLRHVSGQSEGRSSHAVAGGPGA